MTAILADDWHGKKHTLRILGLKFVKCSLMLFNIITNYSPGYVEGVLANVSRALSSCALCALLPMGISLPVLLGLHPDNCHGGPYLNTTIHTTTKSYIISFL